jgi:hypothetical protein
MPSLPLRLFSPSFWLLLESDYFFRRGDNYSIAAPAFVAHQYAAAIGDY